MCDTKLKLKRPIVFFDLETTGVDIEKDRIVQIAAIKIFPDVEKHETYNKLINPGIPIPKQASDVHHIYDSDVAHHYEFHEGFAQDIYNFFRDADIGGFNCRRFDVPLLWRQLSECGYNLPLPRIVDVYQIFVKQFPHTLQGAHAQYFGFPFEDAHDAMADIHATARVFFKQLRHDDCPSTIDELDQYSRNEDTLDLMGKLKRTDNGIVLTFGKYKDVPIQDVPRSYISWCRENNVLWIDALKIIEEAT